VDENKHNKQVRNANSCKQATTTSQYSDDERVHMVNNTNYNDDQEDCSHNHAIDSNNEVSFSLHDEETSK
jgi:hypothetical protein